MASTRIDKEEEEEAEDDEKVFPKSHQKVNSSKQWQTGKQARTGAIKQNHIKALFWCMIVPEFIAFVGTNQPSSSQLLRHTFNGGHTLQSEVANGEQNGANQQNNQQN